ncbi:serine/threonine-protein kinase [Nonomuraea diastatica]|uniref:Serine/threonine protein kinase n=1 Tax=Nonomuraea diastatica TaxID=1848329 RepID=A0A4R4WR80_9ACTN|nr:serine/threonine-protein kinase [Nonomuraea diastatica]TDD19765.1 serine/threonine protein kinase [Nonomuraea diastatica]
MVTPLTPDDPASLGDYRLDCRLGEGGQGVVYLARSPSGEQVAVKLLNTGDTETRARLARELDALAGIASFCTARVLDVSTGGPRPYVVSEYVEGPSLSDRVRERGPLRGGDLERLVVGTATALAAIHAAGIVHRDFKPSNVLLGPDGPRVVDFGIARAEGTATITSGLIGTPAYLAPEQINGTPAAPASDVFAWAASMVYAATGTSPFGADTVPAVLHRVLHAEPDLSPLPPRLRGVIASCLSKDPAHRPSAQQLMVSLVTPGHPAGPPTGPAGSGAPSAGPSSRTGPTGPLSSAETTGETRRARRRGLLLGAVAVVVAAAAATTTALFIHPPLAEGDRSPTAAPPTQSPPAGTPSPTGPSDSPSPDGSSTASAGATPTGSEPSPGQGLRIPARFEGVWTGRTTSTNPMDPDDNENTVELKEGESTARWRERDGDDDCRGTITLTEVEEARLTFALGQNEGGCVPGTIVLALEGDSLAYTWRDVPGLGLISQTGTLNKE